MSVQLLDKTRKIGQLLHNNNSSKVVFNDICSILTQILASNVLVISRKGKVLGVSEADQVSELKEMIVDRVGNFIDPMLNERFLSILSTKENVNLETLGFLDDNIRTYQAIVNPIEIAGERLGTVFMYRMDRPYEIDDIILSEYGTTVVGLEMMRSQSEENEEENRKIQVVKSAISTLSYSEQEAIIHIFRELDGLKDKIVRDADAVNEYTRDFGFFANVSLSEMTSEQAYKIYRGRDNIEKYFESGKMGIKLDTVRAHRQDTMEGRFVVAFVALSIIAELKFQLGQARVFKDKRKKKIAPHEYSVADVIDLTAGITINHAVRTGKSWISGKLNDIARISVACGFSETLYDKVPNYIESISDIR